MLCLIKKIFLLVTFWLWHHSGKSYKFVKFIVLFVELYFHCPVYFLIFSVVKEWCVLFFIPKSKQCFIISSLSLSLSLWKRFLIDNFYVSLLILVYYYQKKSSNFKLAMVDASLEDKLASTVFWLNSTVLLMQKNF